MSSYSLNCDCGSVHMTLTGKPRVRGFCHCEDCRELLKIPFHAVTAWNEEQLEMTQGSEFVTEFQHPQKRMKRVYCSKCGETLFNTNAMGWRIVSQYLLRKCHDNNLPVELRSTSHFFYGRRVVDIDDDLPRRE